MKRLYSTLAILMLSSTVMAQSVPPGSAVASAEQQLLSQIHHGEALFRDDIITEAVKRLYRITPQHPEGLLAEVRLAVRLNQLDQAQAKLDELKAVAPNSEAYKQADLLLHLASSEPNEKLTQARLFAVSGRFEEALDAYDALLNGRYPTAELAQEYWEVHVSHHRNHALAIKELTVVLQRFPRHPALLKSLAILHFTNNQPDQALSYLHQLAERDTDRDWAANKEYEYLRALPTSDNSKEAWEDFIQRYDADDLSALIAKAKLALERQQALLNDPSWRAGQEGLVLVEQEKSSQAAINQLRQAVDAYPEDVELVGALGLAYLRAGQRQQALNYFERALAIEKQDDQKYRWVSLVHSTRYWLTLNQADAAAARQDWPAAMQLYTQAHKKEPKEVFALVGLANTYLATNQPETALSYYKKAIAVAPTNETAQRGVLRYADTLDAEQALDVLALMPVATQRGALFTNANRKYQITFLKEQAEQAQEEERWVDAIAALQQAQSLDPNDPWLSYNLASVLLDQGRTEDAMQAFDVHLSQHHGALATHYAHGLLLASLKQWDATLATLAVIDADAWTEEINALAQRAQESQQMEQAQQLYMAGQTEAAMALLETHSESNAAKLQLATWAHDNNQHDKAIDYYQAALKQEPLPPYSYRELAGSWRAVGGEPQQALDWYAEGMVGAKILSADALSPARDNIAFTRAMRSQETDGWLESGLRKDAEALYQQQNPTLTVHNDNWWRRDGTPGISKLSANTTMVQMEYPIKEGKGFLRADHVRMDAGTLKRNVNGVYNGEFGTCSQIAPGGCTKGLKQTANGTSVAVGWEGDKLAFDLGTTPQGFAVTNWTGAVSYADKIGPTGWRLTASRRPMSNSLLSFAGAKDPRTGTKWGGVMATGAALSLSWDQGEANGVWADISHHKLRGKNVEKNSRTRVMGGYYRRLINKENEELTLGMNAMHWQYRKDLGDYSFGQGGYYSPKQYNSVSLPINYTKRTDDWSFVLGGAVSYSKAKKHNGSSSRGPGYTIKGAVERRLTNHLVVGVGLDLQHSKDYAPSRGMLYLRYTFEPWQGSLPLGIEPLTPYADFK